MAVTTPVITNQFAISQSNSPSSLWNVTDDTDYSGTYGLNPSSVVGILRLEGPSGLIHYNPNFSSPDITPGTTDTFVQSLPLQTGGLPMEGEYAWTYSIRITSSISSVVAGVNGQFIIPIDQADSITEAGTVTIVGSTGNDGTYTVISAVWDSGTSRTIVTVANVPSAVGDGELYYDLVGEEETFEFYFCEPEITIEHDLECNISALQSTDDTNYTISSTTGQYFSLAPTTISRNHRLRAPQGITPAVPDVVGSTAVIVATPIYTKTWTTILTPTVTYDLPSGVQVVYTITATKEINVSCDNNLCTISSCLFNVYDKYIQFRSENYSMADTYQKYLIELTGAYMVYEIGLGCGDTDMKAEALAEMTRIAKATGCDCCNPEADTLPTQIIPLGTTTSGGTTIVATSGNGITITPTIVGSTITYTLALNYTLVAGQLAASNAETLAGAIVTKFVTPAGLKYFIENLGLGNNRNVETDAGGLLTGVVKKTAFNTDFGVDPGDTPAIGSALGNNLQVFTNGSGELITAAAAASYEVLDSQVSDVGNPANTTETDLHTYTMPANTLAVNNNFVDIMAEFTMVPGGDTIYARLYFGSHVLFAGGSSAGYNQVQLTGRVYRTGAATQLFVGQAIYRNTGSDLSFTRPAYANITENLAADVIIKTTGQSEIVGTANVVVGKTLTVVLSRQ